MPAVIARARRGLPREFDGFELNVSCPNTKAGGMEFGADPRALARGGAARARAATTRPLFVKLVAALADIGGAAKIAVDAGADAITLVNTIPGAGDRCRAAASGARASARAA